MPEIAPKKTTIAKRRKQLERDLNELTKEQLIELMMKQFDRKFK